MKKLPVLTCKNSHALISKAIPLLITSLILASTFIITLLPFAQSAPYNTPTSQTNDKGITFNFTIGGSSNSNQDGWCTSGPDSKTFQCTLDFDNKQINLSTSAGDGSDMTHGSSYPLYDKQLPYCWPSWFPDSPNGKNDPYTYYCGFFKKDAQYVAPRKTIQYTYTFTSEGAGLHHDGWCKQLSSDKFQCILDKGNENNVQLPKNGGTGNSMKDPSPTPLYEGELPYCWPSWFPLSPNATPVSNATPVLNATPSPYDYYCGFFKKELQDVTPLSMTNSQGYTFRFTVADPSKNQDGWCNTTSDSKTYLCSLESGNAKNIHLSEGSDGGSLMNGSPKPLSQGQIPFCWPSWLANPPANPTPQPHTAGQYNYYCGFFKKDSANPTATPTSGPA